MPEFEQKKICSSGVRRSRCIETEKLKLHSLSPILTASPEQHQEAAPAPGTASAASGARPFTAVLLEARGRTGQCRVPNGQFGSSKVARFRILDFNGRPVNRPVTVSERFSRIEGPENIFQSLQPASKNTDARGFFNDCYRLFQRRPFPTDFRLKVEQNHLLGTEVISKNHITFTPNNILLCIFRRPPRQHNFESRCRIF